jgi:hypothetical protein
MSAILVPVIAVSAPPARAASLTYTYEVRGLGNASGLEDFAARAAETYGNPIGWNLGGSIGFSRVPSGGDFTLWLAAPQYLPSFSSGCSVDWSCRVGRNVIINEARFLGATTAWNQNGGSLRDYQHMVVNHETGHWLGFGHINCPGGGQLAPVMQQQSKDLQGCRPNPWPTDAERTQLARWKGVPIIPPGPPPVAAGSTVRVPVAGVSGVPANAKAVGLNVTVAAPASPGFLTVFPCTAPLPPTSNLNFAAGQTVAAFTLATPGGDGAVCIRASAAAHIVVDVSGYVPSTSGYSPEQPRRLLDTRNGGTYPTGTVAVAVPAGVAGTALTVTSTASAFPGYLTVYPCDAPRPLASSVNFEAGQNVANMVLASPSADGRVCVAPSTSSHIVVDLIGTFPAGSGFTPQPPQRLLDTRTGPMPSAIIQVPLPGGGLHALNLTVTQPSADGWVRGYPCSGVEPPTSNLNFRVGQTIANAALADAGGSGTWCVRSLVPTHIVVDDNGRLAPGTYTSVTGARLFDSRTR